MKQIFKNFVATLHRYKVSSTLNIFGLAVAFASLYFIGVQLSYDLSFNHDLTDYKQLYRLDIPQSNKLQDGAYINLTPRPIGTAIGEQLPQVESYATLLSFGDKNNIYVRENGEEINLNTNIKQASDGIISLLDIKVVSGDINQFYIQNSPNIIISESLSKQYNMLVGDKVVNRIVGREYTIAAIYDDLPLRSTFADVTILQNIGDRNLDNIGMSFSTHYYKMQKGSDMAEVEATARRVTMETFTTQGSDEKSEEMCAVRFMPLKDSHFANDMNKFSQSTSDGNWSVVYVMILIAVVILSIAFVNFINFFFALVPIRIRAVNARKIFGCSRSELIWSFITEALGLFICSFGIAIIIIIFMQEGFIAEYFYTSVLLADNLDLVKTLALVGVVASTVVALYPALYITSFPAQMVVNQGFAASRRGRILRNSLIGVQFISSMVLFIVAIFMQNQYHYMLNYDYGIDIERCYNIPIPTSLRQDPTIKESLNNKLRECRDIEDFTFLSSIIPSKMGSAMTIEVDSVAVDCNILSADLSIFDFFDLDIVDGNSAILQDDTQTDKIFLMNQTAKRILKNEEDYMSLSRGFEFVGVVKDFNFSSLGNEITPLFFYFDKSTKYQPSILNYRITEDANPMTVEKRIKEIIVELNANTLTQYTSSTPISEQVAKMYGNERKQSRLILIFTIVSIVISLMGVFGLVLFETQFRQQEIVIRRVHGATVPEILMMINRKFLIIIAVCFAVSAPVSYLIVSRWLSTFAYHISISAWVFVAVLAVVTVVTTSIVTVQSLKAANTNPAELIGKNS